MNLVLKEFTPIRIAGLDLETLDTGPNSLVFDVAVVTCLLDENLELKEKDVLALRLDFVEQIALCRTTSAGTIDFHERRLGKEGFRKQLFGQTQYANVDVRVGLNAIRSFLSKTDEIWVNHLTFDCGILRTLVDALGDVGELWHYRVEKDVATVRGSMEAIKKSTGGAPAHDATKDALWNIGVAVAFKQRIRYLESLEELMEAEALEKNDSSANTVNNADIAGE